MSELGRLGTAQRFSLTQGFLQNSQKTLLEDTQRMNSAKRRLSVYEDPSASLISQKLTNIISRNEHLDELRQLATTELEMAETSLSAIEDIMLKIKENSVLGSNGTMGETERLALADQMRNQGLNIVQLLNSKVANKYIFSGVNSDQKTISIQDSADFASAIYRGGSDIELERSTGALQTSVNLTELLTAESASASVTGTNLNPVATGQIRLLVDDGNGNVIDTGDITFSGSNISTIVSRINTAFAAAGGSGAIAQQNPTGYLNLDTSLITGSAPNSDARITVRAGTTVGTALSNTGLSVGTYRGTDGSLMATLSDLEAGYRLNDTSLIRSAQKNLESNISRILAKRTELGHLSKRVEAQLDLESAETANLQVRRANMDDIPVAEALNAITKSQNALNSAMDAASTLFSQNIFDYLNFF